MGDPIRILVVDDDTTDRHLFRVTLENGLDQVTITEADTWTCLTEAFDSRSFDIILTDYQLKGFNGLDVIDEVHQRKLAIPIIMISGTGTEEVAIEAMRRGVHDYVLKSFKHIKRLPAMVKSLVQPATVESLSAAVRADDSRFISAFETSPYGVVLVDERGVIFQGNRAITAILGFPHRALFGKSLNAISHPDDVDDTLIFHRRLFLGEIDNYEHQKRYRHNDGHYVWVEQAASMVHSSDGQLQYSVVCIKDISERKRGEEILQSIARGVAAATGEEFFRSLTKHLADSLETDYALVGELVDDRSDVVKVIAAWCGPEQLLKEVEYPIKDSPYEVIMRDGARTFGVDVQRQFPDFLPLVRLGAESLIGAPLFDSEDRPLGIIAVIHGKQIENIETASSMLQIFSLRASAELERRRSEKALEKSEIRYRTLYDENPSMFFTVNRSGTLLSVNQYGAGQLDYSVEELIGRSLMEFSHEHDREVAGAALSVCFEQSQEVKRWKQRLVRKNGIMLWARVSARRVTDTQGNPNVFVVCEDITEIHELSEQLTYQAQHDPLTKLLNRREFEERLKATLESSSSADHGHALCYLDLDQFKIVNDTCGHIAGDELLRQVAQILRKIVRKRDTLARLGGDEFGILLVECPLENALKVANGALRAIQEAQFIWEEKSFNIGVSIGVVAIGAGSGSIDNVLREADTACYIAKDRGRNRIHVHREDDIEIEQRHGEMEWVARIHRALEQGQFRLYAQTIESIPKAGAGSAHFEILLRMLDDNGDSISPDLFLPAAERYNLSPLIDRWVLSTAMRYLTELPSSEKGLFLVAINLSALTLTDDKFLDFAIQTILDSGIAGEKLCFEITETAAIRSLTSAIGFMNSLKALGCRFALDDFGSGLSSFAYLKTLPVDYLKIDGQFVRDIANDPIDYAMVKSINDIGQVMGKKTVAEFVEDGAILAKLTEIGVDYAQGYHLGVPKPIEDLFFPTARVD